MDGEMMMGTTWQAAIENRAALLADPDARRDYLRDLVYQEQGQLDEEQVVERFELVDASYWWAMEERMTAGGEIVSSGRTPERKG